MGFAWWLTLAFIVLKLTGYIDWSWWIVCSPVPLVYGLVLFIKILQTILEVIEERNSNNKGNKK